MYASSSTLTTSLSTASQNFYPHHQKTVHVINMATACSDVTPVGFHTRDDGYLYCDDVRMSELHKKLGASADVVQTSPVFVYSRRQIVENVSRFYQAFKSLPVPAVLNYSMKANHNLHILKLVQSLGVGVTLVSGTELRLALEGGFQPHSMQLNGSGKLPWEVAAAVKTGVLLNVDSEFCLQQTIDVCRQLGQGAKARVLLRLNLDIDPHVHKYVSTGTAGSKFGLDPLALSRVVQVLRSQDCPVVVEGLHSHLGSTITDTSVFRESVKRLLTLRQELTSQGLKNLRLLNVGGGLGINYVRYKAETQPFREEEGEVKAELLRLMDSLQRQAQTHDDVRLKGLYQCAADVIQSYVKERIARGEMDRQLGDALQRLEITDVITAQFPALQHTQFVYPKAADLIKSLSDVFVMPRDSDVTLMFEPGRAIVGDAGIFLTTTLGWKTGGNTRFLVVDGGMNDVIRPSLYGAYHHISPAAPLSPSPSHNDNNDSNPARDLHNDMSGSSTTSNGHGGLQVVDVVGPVCESGDFLGKDRLLPVPAPGALLVVHDTGAYCASMASNYNLRLRAAEVMVDGWDCDFIRRADNIDDLLAPYKLGSK